MAMVCCRSQDSASTLGSYRGELQCSATATTVTASTTLDHPMHYYSLRIRNSYQSTIRLATCGTTFHSNLLVYGSSDTPNGEPVDDTEPWVLSSERPLVSCTANGIGLDDACSRCSGGSLSPNNQQLEWTNVCTGTYYIQIGGGVGLYELTLSNCEDTPSASLQSIYIHDTLSCDDTAKHGSTWSNDWVHFYELQLDEFQSSLLVSNCGSSFDTKLMIYRLCMVITQCMFKCSLSE